MKRVVGTGRRGVDVEALGAFGAAPGAVGPLVGEQELDAALDRACDSLGRGRRDVGWLGARGGQRRDFDVAGAVAVAAACRRRRVVASASACECAYIAAMTSAANKRIGPIDVAVVQIVAQLAMIGQCALRLR